MISVENKLPAFNNLMSKETLHALGDLDLEHVTMAKCKEN